MLFLAHSPDCWKLTSLEGRENKNELTAQCQPWVTESVWSTAASPWPAPKPFGADLKGPRPVGGLGLLAQTNWLAQTSCSTVHPCVDRPWNAPRLAAAIAAAGCRQRARGSTGQGTWRPASMHAQKGLFQAALALRLQPLVGSLPDCTRIRLQ